MQRQNYDVKCLVSIVPKNRDSFMYHKPDREFLKLQSEALGIPLVVGETPGEKEKELAALKKALLRAKKEFGICGVVSGALYSNYQRERIQRICNSFGLRLFSPLWHKNQLEELRELERNGFVFAMSKIAALGLSGEWLGKPIGAKEIAALGALEKRFGINVAGEGGEYESLVLDAPNFSKKIRIVQSEKKMRNEFTGFLKIKKSVLGEKQGLA
jgi:asparagine synthase (glutamine-hydrolysing)